MTIAAYMHILLSFGINTVSGVVDMSCNSPRPYLGDPLTCTCTTDSAIGIEWQNDGVIFLSCFSGSGICVPVPPEYEVSNDVSGSSKIFQITIKSFTYANCGNLICKDQAGADTITESLSLYAFNPAVPASLTENVVNGTGNIEITTDCVYRQDEMRATWYTVIEEIVEEYTPVADYTTPSSCASDVCGSETAYTLKIGFNYTEPTKNRQKVKFRLEVYQTYTTSLKLSLTTANDYYIEVVTTQDNNINPSLTISPAIATEGSSQTLTCKYSGSESITEIIWRVNLVTAGYFSVSGGSCQAAFPPNATLYSFNCDGSSKTFTLTIKNVSRTNRNDQWDCRVKVPDVSTNRLESNVVEPEVKVLITSVSMTLPQASTVTIQENTPQLFRCVTSVGLPEPTVKWYNDSSVTSNDNEITSSIATTYTNTADDLVITTSLLTFTPTKYDNKISIYCSAYTADQTPIHSIRKPKLNVLYGPDGAPVIKGYTDGATYSVIEDTTGQLTCLIRGGNPLPTLTWTCYSTDTSDNTDADTVSKTARWTAGRGQDRDCTCYSTHFSGNESVTIKVQILYPPTTPIFYMNTTQVSGTVSIIKNNTVSITCSSSGKPNQIQYTWTFHSATTYGAVLNISSVQNNGQCTCEAQNYMDPSDGRALLGINSSFINIDVLYPPVIHDLNNKSVAEGKSLRVTCPVTFGNPAETTFKWTSVDGREWRAQLLTINAVSRSDSMFYSCEVANIMKQTGQQDIITIPDSKRFYLNVLYQATVTSFYISGFAGRTTVTVNENETVSFNCNVDSNPGSDITIQSQAEGKHLQYDINTKSLEYKLNAANCLDAGIYMCLAANQHNVNQSVKQLRLNVNCFPRPSPDIKLEDIITSAHHQAAVIIFTVIAYPEPTRDDFKWFKWNNTLWLSLTNNVAYQIDTEGLQSNLTVIDVNRTSYGIYKLIVTNTIGSHEQLFYLSPEDILPESSCLENDTTTVILGVVLGLIIGALAAYAGYLTILLKRKQEHQGQPSSRPVADKGKNTPTYANLAYTPNVSEIISTRQILENEPAPGVSDYTTLDKQLKDDKSTYDVINAVR